MKLVLASASVTRQHVLAAAGVEFTAHPAPLDERTVERPLLATGVAPAGIAAALAAAKAVAVSETIPDSLVIGADQTLDLDGERFIKPANMSDARAQVQRLAGRTHSLHSALACARGGELVWQHAETARLAMRDLTAADVDRYIAEAGPAILQSVGAYQVEGRGIQLFERIDGDFFTVLGMPILPLLAFLRTYGAIS